MHSDKRLIVDGLSASYHNGKEPLDVFRKVSFEVGPGEVLGLFGSNGSGKTTLLRTIAGLKTPDEGLVRFPQSRDGRARVAMLPQSYRASFFNWASLMNNVRIVLPNPARNWLSYRWRVLEVRHALKLDLNMRLRPSACSGGMLQQAAIIRMFAYEQAVLLADEPFSALDVRVARKVRAAFSEMVKQRDLIALVVLHNLEDIVEVCDRVLVIPGIPFSGEPLQGHSQIKILENQNVGRESRTAGPGSFIRIAERVLTKQA